MTATNSFDCVVDASVGIKFFLKEHLSDRADVLFSHLSDSPPARFYVPNLFFIECTNVLWKHVKRFGYPADVAGQNVTDLIALPLRSIMMEDVAEDALILGTRYNCSTYDAAYVVLAHRLSLPLVTADRKLLRIFSKTDYDIRFLGDWPDL